MSKSQSAICYLLFAICHHRVAVQDGQVIRPAVPDDAPKAVPLILEAIGSIAFVLTATTDRKEAGFILDQFFRQEGNRVSYQNVLVLEDQVDSSEQGREGSLERSREAGFERSRDDIVEQSREGILERSREVVGVALIYDGLRARFLDLPLEKAAREKSGLSEYCIPTEAETSEFYLDTVSVHAKCQGRGFGRNLIETSCEHAREFGHDRIGLLVDVGNLGAKRLYERLGFQVEGEKEIAGDEYFHMVRKLP